MKKYLIRLWLVLLVTDLLACKTPSSDDTNDNRIRVIFDTDTNNELDDQHALAYLVFNQDVFKIEGITVNATFNGGNIDQHYAEAERVLKLCDASSLPLLKGANQSFVNILPTIKRRDFDGHKAVDFIVKKAQESEQKPLVLLAVGKLTNVALALAKDPTIAGKIRLVWLGSNYPEPGEYNQDNDTTAVNYLLNSVIPFEMVTVRYSNQSGTNAVKMEKSEALRELPGKGPVITPPVPGRHEGKFSTIGDYLANLFEHIDYYSDPPVRALFDMAAVAVVKNPALAQQQTIPAPILINNTWKDRPDNAHKIIVWENFNKRGIMDDFLATLNRATQ
ncbi:MAG: nucleoside hydrolase [Cyclobacteriaceae bacterium]|jgi:hypothetical protein|nr:nucleoside hydrolase [Cyclobacteriaceae bacterium]